MQREWSRDLAILAAALGLMALVLMLSAPQHALPQSALPAVETVSGRGIALVDGDVRIDINSADVDMLVSLPGIGETLAQRIVEYREQNGPFVTVDALLQVQGIGQKKLEAIRGQIAAPAG